MITYGLYMIIYGPYMIIYGPYMIIDGPYIIIYGPYIIIYVPGFRVRAPPPGLLKISGISRILTSRQQCQVSLSKAQVSF